jgi:peroxiredoxin
MSPILAAGTVAPNFTLRVNPNQNLTLTDLRGRPVILANDHGQLENSGLA